MKSDGTASCTHWNFRSLGCFGRRVWRVRFVDLTSAPMLGRLEAGTSSGSFTGKEKI